MYIHTVKMYGKGGRPFEEAHNESFTIDYGNGSKLEVQNEDKTGTDEYALVKITAPNLDACFIIFGAEIEEGVFKGYEFGLLAVIPPTKKLIVPGGKLFWVDLSEDILDYTC